MIQIHDIWGVCRITFAGAAVRNVTPGPTQTTDSNDRARLAITHIPAFLDRKQASSWSLPARLWQLETRLHAVATALPQGG